MQILADDQGTFCLFLRFISLVATIRTYYRNLECRNTTAWKINRDRNFKVGIASRKTIRFLTLPWIMISKIQRSWRQFCDVTVTWSFQTGLETIAVYTLRIYAVMNGLGGGAKTDFVPGRRKS